MKKIMPDQFETALAAAREVPVATQEEPSKTGWLQGEWCQLHSGRSVDILALRVEDIDPRDIARALAMQCRYNGHVRRFYSVAEHCVLMADYAYAEVHDPARPETHDQARTAALWALLHDGAESYIGDVVRPLKLQMPEYRALDDRITATIAERFGLPDRSLEETALPPEIKLIDTRILLDERKALLSEPSRPWAADSLQPLGVTIHGWDPYQAEQEYLFRLLELTERAA